MLASPREMGAYYDGYPDPDDSSTWGANPDGSPCMSFDQAQAAVEAHEGPPPTPAPVPGPPSPGSGMPAARLTDLCAHGGVIIAPGCPTVMIGFLPAARVTDNVACPMFDGPVPHVTGMIIKGSNSVLIGGVPAARVSDPINPPSNCKGNQVAMGCTTVLIGDQGAGGSGAPGAAAVAEAAGAIEAQMAQDALLAQARSATAALTQAAATGVPLVEVCKPCSGMRETVQEKKHSIAFRVVMDETGEPIPGAAMKVTLPDGQEQTHTTDADGRIEIDDLEQPGECSITCDGDGGTLGDTFDFVRMGEGAGGATAQSPSDPGMPTAGPMPSAPPAPTSADKSDGAGGGKSATAKILSGASWVKWRDDNIGKSDSLDDLTSPFKENAKDFVAALRAAGATVSINDTLRDKREAYLWHWAWRIDQDGYDPKKVPAMTGVPIEWDHGSNAKSKAGAREMVKGFGLVEQPKTAYAPSLTSVHLTGNAVDMDISWTGDLKIKKKDGTLVTIKSNPKTGAGNIELHKVGASYGVKKLVRDAPHWSSTGQ